MTDRKSIGETIEELDDVAIDRKTATPLADLWQRRIARRGFLAGMGKAALLATASPAILSLAACDDAPEAKPAQLPDDIFSFEAVPAGIDGNHHIAADHTADILIRWGDPILKDAPDLDTHNQSAAAQLGQFGYNNDFIGFIPLPYGSNASDRGLLCIHHEYTNDDLMHPGYPEDNLLAFYTREIIEVSMAAHGGSIIEVARGGNGKWQVVRDSPYNRRITPLATEMHLSGPVAGHPRVQTSEDPEGRSVMGTFNNCAGGITPWGTWLMSEENFNFYFMGKNADEREAENHKRLGVPGRLSYPWGVYHKRFDLAQEPHEPNRYGWVVEVDPLDPASTPVKRTALGRFKREGCENALTKDGRIAVYMGDDQAFEYLYKFVTTGKVSEDRATNASLLDNGTLYVARFEEDGSGTWLPLTFGENGLDETNGFASQADVLIETRRAADLLGATPLDRPEDVTPNEATGRVYVALTNAKERKETNAVNPRAGNIWGQVVELTPGDGDHANETFTWISSSHAATLLIPLWGRSGMAIPAQMIGSPAPIISPPMQRAASGSRPIRVLAGRTLQAVRTGSLRSPPQARSAVLPDACSAHLWVPKSAGHASRRMERHSLSPYNIQVPMAQRTMKASSAPRPSMIRQRAGLISRLICRPALRFSSSRRRMVALWAADERLRIRALCPNLPSRHGGWAVRCASGRLVNAHIA